MIELYYPDTATFVKVSSGGYSNSKTMESQDDVPVIFIQNTIFERANYQDATDSDATCFPDPTNDFVVNNHNRLEGMYILAPLFDASDDEGWYKIERVTVNRDHLLENEIDNIELSLRKARPIAGVS